MSGEKPFDYWEFFVGEAQRANSPLYARYAEGVGGDAGLREFAATAKKGQPHANILFASAHFLLLRGAQHPLRRFYPNLNGGAVVEGEDPFPHFRDFVLSHRAELAPLVATRITNTNEVGRSGVLHAGFRAVAAEAGEPLNLIEIGPSAGLNMIWDRYCVRYRRGDETFEIGTPDCALTIDVELRGDKTPPLGNAPRVASRVGLELNPVDLGDPDARDWLKALVWPEHRARFERLDAALNAYGKAKPEIRVGDALTLLPEALRDAPEHEPVCVYHTYVTYQFTQEMREALDNLLTAAGLRRTVWRLSSEGTLGGENPLVLGRYRDGTRETRTLALCHPHGAWLEWRG
jgi:hypothetical protein